MDGDSGLKFGMIRMVLRMMARITLIRNGAVGLKMGSGMELWIVVRLRMRIALISGWR